MDLGIGGDRDLEIGDALQPGHQVGGIGVAVRMRHVVAAARHVAAQRHDVAHPGLPVGAGDGVDLVAAGAHAGQVRRRGQRGLLQDAGDDGMGARLGGAAGTVGDRDETRRQRLQPADAGPELLFQRLGAGREELEGKRRGGRLASRAGRAAKRGPVSQRSSAAEREATPGRVCGSSPSLRQRRARRAGGKIRQSVAAPVAR